MKFDAENYDDLISLLFEIVYIYIYICKKNLYVDRFDSLVMYFFVKFCCLAWREYQKGIFFIIWVTCTAEKYFLCDGLNNVCLY